MNDRMPRRGRVTTGLTTVALSGVVLLGGVALAGDADAAMAADDCDRDWSVSYPDGSPITSTALFSDELIAPGGSLHGEFLVTTGSDIRGPLELSAERTDGSRLDAATENEILVTLTGSSRAVTVPLSTLLDASEPTRIVDELTPGTHDIGVTVQLPFESENTSQLQELPFQLVVTVSDSGTVVGATPEPCTAVPDDESGAGGATSGSGDPSNLASTGAQAGANVAWAAALLGAGFAAVFAARRRRRTNSDETSLVE